MNTLWLRLAVTLAAVSLMGMALLDVTFFFGTQLELTRARRAVMTAIASAYDLPQSRARADDWQQLAAQHDVAITVWDVYGVRHSTAAAVPLPDDDIEGFSSGAGFEHLAHRPAWDVRARIVVSRRLDDVLPALYGAQLRALLILALTALLMVGAGLLFLRRGVLRPLTRLTELVRRGDRDALERFDTADVFGQLGHGIMSMTHALEEDRAHIAAQLQALASTQEQLVRAERLAVLGQLAAGVAHEIGNPLTVLSGFVELLQNELAPAERTQALQRMGKELTRIQSTVRQLLDFSRRPAQLSDVGDVAEAVQHVAQLLRPQERLRGISVHYPTLTMPMPVALDTNALIQVLLNLLLNAADALAGHGTIAVHAQTDATHVRVTVEDSGPGIAADIAPHVFEPFYTTKAAGVGTGLGLAVCDSIVTGAGGDIRLMPSALGGAAFMLTLRVPKLRVQ